MYNQQKHRAMDKAKVLFIDDDVMLGNIVTTALTDEGYEVHQQNSLLGVNGVISEFKPDILVLDIEIGMEDGIDKMPELHLVAPKLPIIIISSHKEEKEVVRALRNNAVAYLKKPFGVEELIAYIERYINPVASSRITIASLELDAVTRTLYQGAKELKILSKLEIALFILFYERRNEVVTPDEISKLWEGAVVDNHSLYNLIAKLRKLLSVDPDIMIDTVGRNGYIFKIRES